LHGTRRSGLFALIRQSDLRSQAHKFFEHQEIFFNKLEKFRAKVQIVFSTKTKQLSGLKRLKCTQKKCGTNKNFPVEKILKKSVEWKMSRKEIV
jgi:hypothetical protein